MTSEADLPTHCDQNKTEAEAVLITHQNNGKIQRKWSYKYYT